MVYRVILIIYLFLGLLGCAGAPELRSQANERVVFEPWGVIGAKVSDTYQGVVVDQLIEDSSAQRAGIMLGDRILKVNGVRVPSTEKLLNDIRGRTPGEILAVEIQRRGRGLSIEVRVESFPLDEQLYLMTSSAFNTWDSLRAAELCFEYQKRFGPENRLWNEMEKIRVGLARRSISGD